LTEGVSPGVLNGGKLSKKARKVKVKGLLENIPENIIVNISNLQILDSIFVKDIPTDKFEIIENPAKLLVSILSSRNVEIVNPETEEPTEQQ
jgi:large subunit ribosomal protein L25